MKIKLTEKSVSKLSLTIYKYQEYFDDRLIGFGVRCGPKSRVYFVATEIKGRKNKKGRALQIKKNIGKVGVFFSSRPFSKIPLFQVLPVVELALYSILQINRIFMLTILSQRSIPSLTCCTTFNPFAQEWQIEI